ncbi:MAG: fused MFS/spermidine synthase [Candidatus Riflebacteria bacterium]|nr:fused MFS/spermidine synthase [Candidatus Riflebacteria bacterium]
MPEAVNSPVEKLCAEKRFFLPASFSLISIFLFCSGMMAIIFQCVWFQEFRLIFGASTAANGAVLAVFMFGLCAGSLFFGKKADESSSPLTLYGNLEIFTAIFALTTPFLLAHARELYYSLGGTIVFGSYGGTFICLLCTLIILGPPTFCMGGTLPAAAKAFSDQKDLNRLRPAFLYGFNTLGAVSGAVVATFFLLEKFGAKQTLFLAALTNLLIGILARNARLPSEFSNQSEHSKSIEASVPSAQPTLQTNQETFPFIATFFLGFVFFLMEMVWYRMLSPILGGSVYTFGLILIMVLFGIGSGSIIYSVLGSIINPSFWILGITCILEAIFLALPLFLGDKLPLFAAFLQTINAFGFEGRILGWLVISAIVVFPAAAISGFQFPLLISILGKGKENLGKQVGKLYSTNTFGAILGAFCGGFGIMSFIGAPLCWRITVLLLGSLALASFYRYFEYRFSVFQVAFLVPVFLIIFAAFSSEGPTSAWRNGGVGAGRIEALEPTRNGIQSWLNSWRRVMFWESEGIESYVSMIKSNGISFLINGKSDGNAKYDMNNAITMGLISSLISAPPQKALIIGLGTGMTAGWLAQSKSVSRVDVAELEEETVQVASFCSDANMDVLKNPKVNLFIGDGREFLFCATESYDLIVSQPSNPYRAGVSSLFTKDFYEVVNRRLNENGILVQWVQAYEIDAETMQIIFATLSSVFPHVEIWQTNTNDLLLICSRFPQVISPESVRRKLAEEPFASGFKHAWNAFDVTDILARYVASSDFTRMVVSQSFADVPLNTDDQMIIEYRFAKIVGKKNLFSASVFRSLAQKCRMHRPALSDSSSIDWTEVDRRSLMIYPLDGMHPIIEKTIFSKLSDHISLYSSFVDGKFNLMNKILEKKTFIPDHPFDLLIAAESLANIASTTAKQMLQKIEQVFPLESEFIKSRFEYRTGNMETAVKMLENAFQKLRRAPYINSIIAERSIQLCVEIVKAYPEYGEKIFYMLNNPFSLYMLEEVRLGKLVEIVPFLKDDLALKIFHLHEPHVPWGRTFLEKRFQCYHKNKDPLEDKAFADLSDFVINQNLPLNELFKLPD